MSTLTEADRDDACSSLPSREIGCRRQVRLLIGLLVALAFARSERERR